MSDFAIRAEGLGKEYRIGQLVRYKALRDTLTDSLYAPLRRLASLARRDANVSQAKKGEYIWALRDVSFEIKHGEVVGIIGGNGAGKSTLLKILSRITEPTQGQVIIRGRVGSLLEVGTGFHPELTGRENIYLNGAILGMGKREIERKFDEIVAFAEVEKFIDTPVKHYSSGMYVRLAFAVAAHLEPEILLVDEVLAVGDAAFQKKCLGKMGDVAKQGRTVLFVSHNMGAITRLCPRSLWLNGGKIVLDGLSNEVVAKYQSQYLTTCSEWKRPVEGKIDGDVAFLTVTIKNHEGQPSSIFRGDEPILMETRYWVRRPLSGCQIGVRVYNSDGLCVFTTADADYSGSSALPKESGYYRARVVIPESFLAPGTYYILLAAHLPGRNMYEVIEQAVVFEVLTPGSLASLDGRVGVVVPMLSWSTLRE